ncbi:unnamed protein product [Closterium sp. NIES-53]
MYLMTCTRPDLAYPLSLLARYVAPGRHRKVHWDAAKRVLRYLCSTSGMGLVLGGRARVVLTGHADASWAEIYAGAMAAQELRWLTYLLTDLGEAPRSPPFLYQNGQLRLAYVASQANTADVFTKALQPCDHQLRYAAHQLNLWPSDARPQVTSVSLWTGSPGVAADFRILGSLAHVRAPGANKLSPRTHACVFLGFPLDASGWVFYDPVTYEFFASQDVTFVKVSVTTESPPPRCVARHSAVVPPRAPSLCRVTPMEDTAASSRRPRPASPLYFPSVPQFPPRSSLWSVAAELGGVPTGGTGDPRGVTGGGACSGGAGAGSTGTVPPTRRVTAAPGEGRAGVPPAAAGAVTAIARESRGGVTAAAAEGSAGVPEQQQGQVPWQQMPEELEQQRLRLRDLPVPKPARLVRGPLRSPPVPPVQSLSSSQRTRRSPLSYAVSPEPRRSRYHADGPFHLVLRSRVPPPLILPQHLSWHFCRRSPTTWDERRQWPMALQALDFFLSSADPSLFVRRGSTWLFVLVYILTRFRFSLSKVQLTPLAVDHGLTALPSDESFESSGPYPQLVGCLMFLMTYTRPDLAYPLSILARFVAPGIHRPSHWYIAKRVTKYVASTSGMGLVLGGKQPITLIGYSDSSWPDDAETRWSTQGCEAEVYAVAIAAQELRWLSFLLTDLGERLGSPPVLFADNSSVARHSYDVWSLRTTRHISSLRRCRLLLSSLIADHTAPSSSVSTLDVVVAGFASTRHLDYATQFVSASAHP